jgi:hypothetical protein
MTSEARVLEAGEFFHKERFGPATVNRGAVLLECEWDGGVFEAGVMLGGFFRSGEFRGGTFWGGHLLGRKLAWRAVLAAPGPGHGTTVLRASQRRAPATPVSSR